MADFENYIIEDEDEKRAPRLTMWSIVPRIMIMPASGWALARKNGPSPEIATIRFLLPMSLAAGISNFFTYFYPGRNSFTTVLVGAVITFCSFFLAYYIALLLQKLFLPKEGRDLPATSYGKLLTMTGIGTLALFHILTQALPMLDVILEFLPLWTIFLLYTGLKNTGVNNEKFVYALGVVCIVVVCSPYLVEWIFSLFT